MPAALYELLTGRFADGRPLESAGESEAVFLSVMDSVRRIVNTRAGTLKHLPDYGLPDLSLIYQELPASAHDLLRAMERVLPAYEPRLESVSLTIMPPDEDMVLKYMLTCRLRQKGLLRFGAYFTPDGRAGLARWSD